MQLATSYELPLMPPKPARHRCRGQDHPKAVLSDRDVELMRQLHEDEGWGYKRLAKKFDCPKATVQAVCNYSRR